MAKAKAKIEIKVSVEKSIHNVLQRFIQKVWDDHGIVIDRVFTDWIDAPGKGKVLNELSIETRTRGSV